MVVVDNKDDLLMLISLGLESDTNSRHRCGVVDVDEVVVDVDGLNARVSSLRLIGCLNTPEIVDSCHSIYV